MKTFGFSVTVEMSSEIEAHSAEDARRKLRSLIDAGYHALEGQCVWIVDMDLLDIHDVEEVEPSSSQP